jgi:hypothetical protein
VQWPAATEAGQVEGSSEEGEKPHMALLLKDVGNSQEGCVFCSVFKKVVLLLPSSCNKIV